MGAEQSSQLIRRYKAPLRWADDGGAYTHAQFVEYYGEDAQWCWDQAVPFCPPRPLPPTSGPLLRSAIERRAHLLWFQASGVISEHAIPHCQSVDATWAHSNLGTDLPWRLLVCHLSTVDTDPVQWLLLSLTCRASLVELQQDCIHKAAALRMYIEREPCVVAPFDHDRNRHRYRTYDEMVERVQALWKCVWSIPLVQTCLPNIYIHRVADAHFGYRSVEATFAGLSWVQYGAFPSPHAIEFVLRRSDSFEDDKVFVSSMHLQVACRPVHVPGAWPHLELPLAQSPFLDVSHRYSGRPNLTNCGYLPLGAGDVEWRIAGAPLDMVGHAVDLLDVDAHIGEDLGGVEYETTTFRHAFLAPHRVWDALSQMLGISQSATHDYVLQMAYACGGREYNLEELVMCPQFQSSRHEPLDSPAIWPIDYESLDSMESLAMESTLGDNDASLGPVLQVDAQPVGSKGAQS